jgi:hypothetical protein
MDCSEMISYIFNSLNRNKDEKINDTILYYIRSNGIACTENKNGIFLNLSTLESDNIIYIYNLIKRTDICELNDGVIETETCEDSETDSNEENDDEEELILSKNNKSLIEYTKMI